MQISSFLFLTSVLDCFLRDRFRTMVNVMGDALATGIMAHICRKDFMKEGDGVGPLVNCVYNVALLQINIVNIVLILFVCCFRFQVNA